MDIEDYLRQKKELEAKKELLEAKQRLREAKQFSLPKEHHEGAEQARPEHHADPAEAGHHGEQGHGGRHELPILSGPSHTTLLAFVVLALVV